MIESKEQYEGIKERYPGAVPSDVIELIEALREVVRVLKASVSEDFPPKSNRGWMTIDQLDAYRVLDTLPDWITE